MIRSAIIGLLYFGLSYATYAQFQQIHFRNLEVDVKYEFIYRENFNEEINQYTLHNVVLSCDKSLLKEILWLGIEYSLSIKGKYNQLVPTSDPSNPFMYNLNYSRIGILVDIVTPYDQFKYPVFLQSRFFRSKHSFERIDDNEVTNNALNNGWGIGLGIAPRITTSFLTTLQVNYDQYQGEVFRRITNLNYLSIQAGIKYKFLKKK